jgi:DNA-directed RNA polymerase subunit omega
MMLYPPIGELLSKVDSRYTLVIKVAKRARQLNNGAKKLTDVDSIKNVSIAIEEVNNEKIGYKRTKDGIK